MNNKNIPVIILCGGKGTRLREETTIIPKPLVRIGDKPILWHIMKNYSTYGLKNFILPVGYKGEKIKEYFYQYPIINNDFTISVKGGVTSVELRNRILEDWKITIVDTGLETQTGARIRKLEKYISESVFMVTYGDGVADINIKKLLNLHRKEGRIGTVTGVKPPARFGKLVTEGNRVKSFVEKGQVKSEYIDGGFFVFNKELFEWLGDGESLSLERDVLPKLAQKKQLSVFKHDGYWQCMDTLRDVLLLEKEWNSGKAPWKVWSK